MYLKKYKKSIKSTFRLILKDKISLIGLIMVLSFILLGTIGPMVIPYDVRGDPSKIYLPPSWEHPLGTDFQGRDILSQIVHGTPIVLKVAFLSGLFTVLIALLIGSIAGFKGGLIDSIFMAIADVILTLPIMPLFMVLSALIKFKNVEVLSLLIAIFSWPALSRAIRSQILSMKEREFVEAAKALGFGTLNIILYEIIPNIMPFIAVSFIFASIQAIYIQVGLAYLGLVPYIGENWGIMINRAWTLGAIFYKGSFMYIMSPIIAIILLNTALMLFSRALEYLFNPRIRGE